MDTLKVTDEYRLSQWMKTIQEKQNSGQTIKDFCQARGVNKQSYYYWQRKLRKVACTEMANCELSSGILPNGWAQLEPAPPMTSSLEIEAGGCHISVNNETDLELLKKVCRMLGSI